MENSERNALVEGHLDVADTVTALVCRSIPHPTTQLREEIHSECLLLLLDAAQQFDPTRIWRASKRMDLPARPVSFRAWAKRFILWRIYDVPTLPLRRHQLHVHQATVSLDAVSTARDGHVNEGHLRKMDMPLLPACPPTQHNAAVLLELRERVAAAVASLPPDEREVLEARFVHERSIPEIARGAALRPTTVAGISRRAFAHLRHADLEDLLVAA